MNNIFDSHAHYDDARFNEDRAELLSSLQNKGVRAVLNAGCDMCSSREGIRYTQQYDYFYAAVGIHPQAADEFASADIEELRQLAQEEKVVAIGEIGLDYHYETPSREIQKPVFEAQLQLAKELDMPVIVHSREATADVMALLHKYQPKGVVHCFSGSAETAKEVLALGMYIGFTGVVTFGNAKKVLEAATVTPLNRLLLETDCPYMAPAPFRGKRCDSSMIAFTASKLAEIKGLETQQLIDIATENTYRMYEITR
ncbi:TatD family hydrolase [Acetanaerobacterium elongatum]|uniref:TatD DNase family protein n=1 Tax=Acetanaerobacterium elongatum TaxID=258515 RepID=A0A1H0GQZ4_9FIRM|nr:TatD family hydrolase [Acetanaerobacterium elongatum]SDO09254.1 TatD DNase family protein [Acetanaerobacterium elongatum]